MFFKPANRHYLSLQKFSSIPGGPLKTHTHPSIYENKMCLSYRNPAEQIRKCVHSQILANDNGTLNQKKCSRLLAEGLLRQK